MRFHLFIVVRYFLRVYDVSNFAQFVVGPVIDYPAQNELLFPFFFPAQNELF